MLVRPGGIVIDAASNGDPEALLGETSGVRRGRSDPVALTDSYRRD
jgi:hypothetical protein